MAIELRFLDESDFASVHAAFLSAFSTYVVKMAPSADQLREMMARRGLRWDLSVGAFDATSLVAFNLNGFGSFDSAPTVYDLGTGVTPRYRGQHLTRKMFEFSLRKLRDAGAKQYLLEVIDSNVTAARAYEGIGFRDRRKLDCYILSKLVVPSATPADVRPIDSPRWSELGAMCDFSPSWQNTTQSILRSREPREIVGAWDEDRLCGFGIIFPSSGDVPQLAVLPDSRRKGLGAQLAAELQRRSSSGSLRFINVDAGNDSAGAFLRSLGAELLLSQREMLMSL